MLSNYEKAVELAKERHKEQDYSGKPYFAHLLHVQQVLERFGYHPENKSDPEKAEKGRHLVVAAILHDIVEDTPTTIDEIRKEFGSPVANLVKAVTNEPGGNRAERHKKTYPKIKAIPNAIILKLADRIANIESCLALKDGRIKMYKKERESFEQTLRVEGEHDDMWNYLDFLLRG
jgi:guanosine-3',5'-bis(diphosphate) 3'-pyrophosphohydrolase